MAGQTTRTKAREPVSSKSCEKPAFQATYVGKINGKSIFMATSAAK